MVAGKFLFGSSTDGDCPKKVLLGILEYNEITFLHRLEKSAGSCVLASPAAINPHAIDVGGHADLSDEPRAPSTGGFKPRRHEKVAAREKRSCVVDTGGGGIFVAPRELCASAEVWCFQ
jgi:hypothetical protein